MKAKIIDFAEKKKARSGSKETRPRQTAAEPVDIIDITERRAEAIQSEKRRVKRTILSEFIGTVVVVPRVGLQRVTIYDISEEGIAFDVPEEVGQFHKGEEVAMRVYLNKTTYFPFIVKIANLRPVQDEAVVRHGANFLKDTINDEALYHFVKFIETVSASLQHDGGDKMVSNLGNLPPTAS
jgi:hypothetical protein